MRPLLIAFLFVAVLPAKAQQLDIKHLFEITTCGMDTGCIARAARAMALCPMPYAQGYGWWPCSDTRTAVTVAPRMHWCTLGTTDKDAASAMIAAITDLKWTANAMNNGGIRYGDPEGSGHVVEMKVEDGADGRMRWSFTFKRSLP